MNELEPFYTHQTLSVIFYRGGLWIFHYVLYYNTYIVARWDNLCFRTSLHCCTYGVTPLYKFWWTAGWNIITNYGKKSHTEIKTKWQIKAWYKLLKSKNKLNQIIPWIYMFTFTVFFLAWTCKRQSFIRSFSRISEELNGQLTGKKQYQYQILCLPSCVSINISHTSVAGRWPEIGGIGRYM